MKSGFKFLIVLVVISIIDAISSTIIIASIPTWNWFIVFGISFIIICIIAFVIYIEFFE